MDYPNASSDNEYKKSFSQRLKKCLELANQNGLSKMTMSEITNEIKAVRKFKKR
jgi:DNA-binding Xre family transcriptional regulator